MTRYDVIKLVNRLEQRNACKLTAGGLGQQGNSSATPTMMILDKLIVQHGMALDFEEDD